MKVKSVIFLSLLFEQYLNVEKTTGYGCSKFKIELYLKSKLITANL